MPTPRFHKLRPPGEGTAIQTQDGRLAVPADPVIPYIRGDGIGPEVITATREVLDAAVATAYGGERRLVWWRILAGTEAEEPYGELLPPDVFAAVRHYVVALKGPLTTPIGGGYRSLNVTLRQELDLYANVRPIAWIPGIPSPLKHPERVDLVVFREATEDVYAGIEWAAGSEESRKLLNLLEKHYDLRVKNDPALGLKPISEFASKRLVRKALTYAVERGRRNVTLMHKGNIMKYTEGAFMRWGYEIAVQEFRGDVVTEEEVRDQHEGTPPEGKVLVKDRLADNMLQQLLTRTAEYDIIATTNLNGDYVSDAAAGLVGGLGVAPGANIGDHAALFEPIHGSAPKYAGQDIANPMAEILAGAMLLEYIGWSEASHMVRGGVSRAVLEGDVTQDLARQVEGTTVVGTRAFAQSVVDSLL
ncbi:MAG: isocitrate dehydrogenase (NADP(+)) [Candidatus Thermoplasmatota archaeon]|nr:isocitrate dehydrogenase (NADP(+)) [Candidatus Thermoplasmatota archaeon]